MKTTCLRLAILAFALLVSNAFAEDTNKMVLRCHSVPRSCFEDPAQAAESSIDKDLRSYFEKAGVTFPPNSFITYDHDMSVVCMFNTESNQALLAELSKPCEHHSHQIELDASFIAFDLPEIEGVARKNLSASPTQTQIAELWKSGKGRLLGTQKLITRSGVNAQSQGVDEQIYPTEFVPSVQTNAPATQTLEAKVLPTPALFETREVGMIFNITPTVGPDGRTIDLVLAPEISDGVEWDDVTTTLSRGENSEENLIVRQPRFHTAKLTTTIAVEDGATFIQGGMASRDGQSLIYLFLTARIIGTDGQPVHPDAKPKIQEAAPAKK